MNESPVLDSLLNNGAYLIVRDFGCQQVVLEKAKALIRSGVEKLAGPKARGLIEERGLERLHEVITAEQIGPLRDLVMPGLRPDLFDLACAIGRKLLGIEGEFFVDDYTILRINFPYLAALQAPRTAENPGIGRMDDRTRELAKEARVVDPVYDPKSYHNNEPPPAWAHGAHQDTWTGHSRFGVNLWWAVSEVVEENSMIFYPGTFGRPFEPDPRSLYLKEGQPLPKPAKMALHRGEMLVFNPELLHSTHLNTTNATRLALSTRINPRRPKFSPGCFYAREFWHSSVNLEQGRHDEVIRFERANNLDDDPASAAASSSPAVLHDVVVLAITPAPDEWFEVCPSTRLASGGKLLVRLLDGRDILVMRGTEKLHATQSRCAHLNVSLLDGYHDDQRIYCPAHGVAFCLGTGKSSCEALRLRAYDVREAEGIIRLRLSAPGSNVSIKKQRLTVSIITRDSESRLEQCIAEARDFADEVIVGVDAASSDQSFEIASALADVVYRFRLPAKGQLAPARLLALEHATGDWILSLDDDESMEETFDAILPELMNQTGITHYHFPRKSIVDLNPCEYLRVPPWFPDWQLRLFLNDQSIVWKPSRPHTGYWVQGTGFFEARTSILHFEPLLCGTEERRQKIKTYQQAGSSCVTDDLDRFATELPRHPAKLRPAAGPQLRPSEVRIHSEIRELQVTVLPPWGATILTANVPPTAPPGFPLLAEVLVRNSGKLSWEPHKGRWPFLNLGFHLLNSQGEVINFDGGRFPMPRVVPPGGEVLFIGQFEAPGTPGDYLLEWDMVSEGECWFADCGSTVLRTPLQVT